MPAWLVSKSEAQLDDKTFQLHNFEDTLTLRAENKFLKHVWVSALRKILSEIQQKHTRIFEMPNSVEDDPSRRSRSFNFKQM